MHIPRRSLAAFALGVALTASSACTIQVGEVDEAGPAASATPAVTGAKAAPARPPRPPAGTKTARPRAFRSTRPSISRTSPGRRR